MTTSSNSSSSSSDAPSSYSPPVDRLLTYADCLKVKEIPNYVEELQFTAEHIPDLIRMATDKELLWAETESLEVWAPVHAWRSLGQLRAEAAIEPLLPLFDELEDDDWVAIELPRVFAEIGAAAIPPLAAYLADPSHSTYPRVNISSALAEIGKQHPETRADCIQAITQVLERFWNNPPTLNGFLISSLLDLQAVEALPLMKRVYESKRVDISINGFWEEIEVELGLKSREEAPPRKLTRQELREFHHYDRDDVKPLPIGFAPKSDSKQNKHKKKKRK